MITFELGEIRFFEGFCFIGDEGVIVAIGGDGGNDLPGLIFDDDCLWGFGLFFV